MQEDVYLPPPHSAEALQELASAVASVLWKDENEVMALLQQSAYGRQRAPVPLPDIAQVSYTPGGVLQHKDKLGATVHQTESGC